MPTDVSTYAFNHTSLRVKDVEVSIKFYTEVLGMKFIAKSEVPEFELSVNFVGYIDSLPDDELERKKLAFSEPGIIELVQCYGTQKQEGKIYSSGNEEVGKGYGHIAVLVDDAVSACERFKSLGVIFAKELKEGPYHTFAYITDPDGYFIEIIENPKITGKTPV